MNTPNPNPSPESVKLVASALCRAAGMDPEGGARTGYSWIDHETDARTLLAALSPPTLPAPGQVDHIADAGNVVEVECIRRAIWGYVNAQPEDAAMLPLVQFLANRDVFLAEAIAPATVAAANDEGVADLQVLRAAVKNLLPIGNDQLPGDRVIPIYVRMDELRALHTLATSRSQHEGASS